MAKQQRLVKFIDIESRMAGAGTEERADRSWCLMVINSQFYEMKRVLGMSAGDGCKQYKSIKLACFYLLEYA